LKPPMLVTHVEHERLLALVDDDCWEFAQKVDGHRRMVAVVDGKVFGINRSGRPAVVPPAVTRVFEEVFAPLGDWLFDGELIGNEYWVFDMVEAPEAMVHHLLSYAARRTGLEAVAIGFSGGPVHLLPVHRGAEAKALLYKTLLENHGEGVVARGSEAGYEFGHRCDQVLAAKFTKDVDVVVKALGIGGKDNIEIGVYVDGVLTPIGVVTAMSGDGARLKVGDVCAVKYLTWSGTRLIQPTTPRLRTSKQPHECTMDQLVLGRTKEVLHG
jgi:ATP-dependent DNA ligase